MDISMMERRILYKYSKATGKGQHGNHPNYTTELLRRLTQFKEENPGLENALDYVRKGAQELKETIQNNPTTKINDLFKGGVPSAAPATPVIPTLLPSGPTPPTSASPTSATPAPPKENPIPGIILEG
jgi:hypothetical protein